MNPFTDWRMPMAVKTWSFMCLVRVVTPLNLESGDARSEFRPDQRLSSLRLCLCPPGRCCDNNSRIAFTLFSIYYSLITFPFCAIYGDGRSLSHPVCFIPDTHWLGELRSLSELWVESNYSDWYWTQIPASSPVTVLTELSRLLPSDPLPPSVYEGYQMSNILWRIRSLMTVILFCVLIRMIRSIAINCTN
jgi:hypothetical protein